MQQTSCAVLSIHAPFKSRYIFQPPYYYTLPDAYSIIERLNNDKWWNRLLNWWRNR